MALTDEEQRAKAWRRQQRRQAAWRAAQEAQLSGDRQARDELDDDWAPLRDQDRREARS